MENLWNSYGVSMEFLWYGALPTGQYYAIPLQLASYTSALAPAPQGRSDLL